MSGTEKSHADPLDGLPALEPTGAARGSGGTAESGRDVRRGAGRSEQGTQLGLLTVTLAR
jgi:hypothetical protein